MSFLWPVVPLCEAQRKDVRAEDILAGGLFRKCTTHRGGGGYDMFPAIYEKRHGSRPGQEQFVVQLHGCPLNCPYCYVTRAGVLGQPKRISTKSMLDVYRRQGLDVFHLMGGAPALYLAHWRELASRVKIFHSDFLLIEGCYQSDDLVGLPGLHAVSIKAPELYTPTQMEQMWENLWMLILFGVDFYITFTGSEELKPTIIEHFGVGVLEDSFTIDIVNYKALESTDG